MHAEVALPLWVIVNSAVGITLGGAIGQAKGDGAFAVDDAGLGVECNEAVDEVFVVKLVLRGDSVCARSLVEMQQAVAADERSARLVLGEERRGGLEACRAHAERGADGLSFPIYGVFRHSNADVGRVEVVGIGQQCQLVNRSTLVQQAHTAFEMVEAVLGIHLHGAGKAKGRREGELSGVGYLTHGHAHTLCIGGYLGHINRLFLLVNADIVDCTLAAVFLAVGHHQVAVVEEMEGTVAREEELSA